MVRGWSSLQAIRLVDTRDMPREEWLKRRQRGIGGSDIAACAGMHPWRTPLDVWLDKTGKFESKPETEAMMFGRKLEGFVAQEFAERHPEWRVEEVDAILGHPKYPWALANIDRLLIGPDGEEAVLEVKTTNSFRQDEFQEHKLPDYITLQLMWYLGICGLKRGFVAVLIGGQAYREYEVEFDRDLFGMLLDIAEGFWALVENETPPAPDGSEASTELLNRMYPEGKGTAIDLPPESADLVEQYCQARAEEKVAGLRKTEAENRLKAMLGENERGYAGFQEIQWKTVRSQRLDTKALRAEEPDIYERFLKESSYRRFSIPREESEAV